MDALGAGLVLLGIVVAVQDFMTQAQQVLAPVQEGIPLPVIMYHSILKDPAQAGEYVLSPTVLASDLDYLREQGYETVAVEALIEYVEHGTPLPAKPVLITFDDGYYNNFVYAEPLLKERDMCAVISIIGSQTALFTENGQENPYWSHLTLGRLTEMERSGVFEVENHSYDLHHIEQRKGCLKTGGESLTEYESMLTQDTLKTQTLLVDAGLPAPVCYTYPYGALSDESEEILQKLGFRMTFSCEEGMNYMTRDSACLYRLKRYNRPSGISTGAFMKKLLSA